VGFRYTDKEVVLPDFSLTIRPKETVALVGHTGAGKSSIAKLLTRFYEFQDGALLVDGRDIRTLDLGQYRRHIGLVPQEPYLFSGTVKDNIRYGYPEATDDEVCAAATAHRRRGPNRRPDTAGHGLGRARANSRWGKRQARVLRACC
jgi:ATP-binding cassette subfamily B protein